MNPVDNNQVCTAKIDASCRVPLLALFGVASLCLVLGLVFAVIASLTFHNPEILADCPCLTYGHTQAVANDLLVYGFAMPAALGVMLWIFARLSQAELALPIVPVAAANLWLVGMLIGVATILGGGSSGYTWLEFPRFSAMLLGVSFVLVAVSAVATFGQRKERELYPSHWFLLASLLWFPWIYSTANLFIVSNYPVRGVAQAVINWWYADNLIFVWLALIGIGTAFYFIPKITGQPLKSRFYALFAFWTLIVFGTWIGIPAGAPVPAWLPTASAFASYMLLIPILAVAIVLVKTLCGNQVVSRGASLCYFRSGTVAFLLSALMLVVQACPEHGGVLEFTWFGQAQVQLQILGFAGLILCGAINYIFPLVMGAELPYKKFVQVQFFLMFFGILGLVIPLAIGGVLQGRAGYDPLAAKIPLMISTTGLLLVLVGSLLMFLNIFVMTFKWKVSLAKSAYAAVIAPLTGGEVKS